MALPVPPTQHTNMLPSGGEDPLSPTTIILNSLKNRGVPITPDNIRRAVIENARNSDQAGPDPAGYVSDTGRQISLRNAAPENSSPASSGKSSAKPGPAGVQDEGTWDQDIRNNPSSQKVPSDPMQQNPVPPRAAEMPLGQQVISGLPPGWGGGGTPLAPVPGGGPPSAPPPPAGAEATIPPPPTGLEAAMQRAVPPQLPGPPAQLALPAPPSQPAIGGPPPQLALPAPPTAPTPAALPPPPEVPRIAGPQPQLALPPPPDVLPGNLGEPKPRVTVEPMPNGPAPGKQVQGYPIQETPASRIVGKTALGAVKGSRGGLGGAVAGGGEALARELAEYILKGGKLN